MLRLGNRLTKKSILWSIIGGDAPKQNYYRDTQTRFPRIQGPSRKKKYYTYTGWTATWATQEGFFATQRHFGVFFFETDHVCMRGTKIFTLCILTTKKTRRLQAYIMCIFLCIYIRGILFLSTPRIYTHKKELRRLQNKQK